MNPLDCKCIPSSEIKKVLFTWEDKSSRNVIGMIIQTIYDEVYTVTSFENGVVGCVDPSVKDVIYALGKSGVLLNIAVSGGGVTGISDLFTESGCSAFIESFYVPYSTASFDHLVDRTPESHFKYVSEYSAMKMASAMLKRSNSSNGKIPIGVGVTAKLAVPNEREGREHQMFLSIRMDKTGNPRYQNFKLTPKEGSRKDQEAEVARYIRAILLQIPSLLD